MLSKVFSVRTLQVDKPSAGGTFKMKMVAAVAAVLHILVDNGFSLFAETP